VKVTAVTVLPVLMPPPPGGWPGSVHCALTLVDTDGGARGVGLCVTSRPRLFRSLVTAIEELGEVLVGLDASTPERVHAALTEAGAFFGPGGMLAMAVSALDTAVWDLVGKDAGLPLWKLLGGAADRVRVYDSGPPGSPLLDVDELQRAAAASVRAGHRALKVRPGPARDCGVASLVARMAAVREAVGPGTGLILDVNQGWSPAESLRMLRALEEFELLWVEDPTRMDDVAGQAEVAAAVATPVCAGEYHAGPAALLRLIRERAADILMVDLMRVGGITPFRWVAGAAAADGIPLVSHLFPEVFAPLIAAWPNGYMVEQVPWSAALFEEVPTVTDGYLQLGNEPGLGLRVDRGFAERHRAW
jgi:L-alanine-DL-glutamate epimerase-like enolase superfamily enzyme